MATKKPNPYRNAYADEPGQPDMKYCDLTKPFESPESKVVTASANWLAMAQQGAGGPLVIRPLGEAGRGRKSSPKVNFHGGKVNDLCFSPFNPNLLITGAQDKHICVTQLTANAEKELAGPIGKDDDSVLLRLEGHGKKVSFLSHHPVADGIVGSTSWDRTVKVWDIEAGEEAFSVDAHDHNTPFSLEWNRNGSLIATTAKDHYLRIFDPRAPEAVRKVMIFESSKVSKLFWAPRHNMIGAFGFTKKSKRQLKLWDLNNLETPVFSNGFDNTSSIFFPTFDDETSLLWLWSKGDGSMSYNELNNHGPFIKPLYAFRSSNPTKGGCFIPKTALDTENCELARFMKLATNPAEIIPLKFMIPRSVKGFAKELFPDCPSNKPAMKAEAYKTGEDEDPVMTSMDPETLKAALGIEVTVKMSYAQLMEQNEALKARVAELEEQLATN